MSGPCASEQPSAPATEKPRWAPSGYFLGLDGEFNQPSKKWIQVGAAVMYLPTGEIVDRLSVFVQPDEPMDYFVMKLTGIDDQLLLAEGEDLPTAYRRLCALHRKWRCFCNPVVWGTGDAEHLHSSLPAGTLPEWPFGRRSIDAKTLFTEYMRANNENTKGSLAKAMTRVGLRFRGVKHHADDDAVNTLLMWRRMLELLRRDPTQTFTEGYIPQGHKPG